MNGPSLSQLRLLEQLLPLLQSDGRTYRKHRCVMARRALVGEIVESITAAGRETVNVGHEGAYVVRNQTEAGELYIVSGGAFHERYELEQAVDEWSRYRPIGQVIALEVSEHLLARLSVTHPFYIEAAWKELQIATLGDFLVCPLDGREIYRIARQEFDETYVTLGDGSPRG
jgi:hypothetical protein